MDANLVTQRVIGAAIEVHRTLGPGLLESVYEQCLCHELSIEGLAFQRQIALPIRYKQIHLACGYRLDLLVEQRVIVELKTVERLLPVHEAQVMTYLRLQGCQVALLINFNVPVLKDGIKRLVLGFEDRPPSTA